MQGKIVYTQENKYNIKLLDKNNPTNGDVIRAMYPNMIDYGSNEGVTYVCLDNRYTTTFETKWWNSPYLGYWEAN